MKNSPTQDRSIAGEISPAQESLAPETLPEIDLQADIPELDGVKAESAVVGAKEDALPVEETAASNKWGIGIKTGINDSGPLLQPRRFEDIERNVTISRGLLENSEVLLAIRQEEQGGKQLSLSEKVILDQELAAILAQANLSIACLQRIMKLAQYIEAS